MTTRPKAKWKVGYDAKVAALDNDSLLAEVFDNHAVAESEQGDNTDRYQANVTQAELRRRLTESGFLPGPAPVGHMPWDALKPDDQMSVRRQFSHLSESDRETYLASLRWAFVNIEGKWQWVATPVS